MTPAFWKGKRVLITGHTGFKGAWLAAWLDRVGARVIGLSHAPEGEPNLWSLLDLEGRVTDLTGDIRDPGALDRALADGPDVVFHLAAQSLVRRSYVDPVETFSSNVTGTVAVLHAVAQTPSVRAVVVATSDKAYENLEQGRPFQETDRYGGSDPYSASKGAAEIAVTSMRRSFFAPGGTHPAGVASVRAGNVIGGGDWSEDRLVPDIVRGCLSGDGAVTLRAPTSIRPWQHVMEPLRGYVTLAEKLTEAPADFADGWNFGPAYGDEHDVQSVATGIVDGLGQGRIVHDIDPNAPKEARILRLDSRRANDRLGWKPALNFADTVAMTAAWYADWHAGANVTEITQKQIDAYMALAAEKEMT
ncbi:MAG: CDP-glucose 4,6-dehydratase [Marinibacterium sp.]